MDEMSRRVVNFADVSDTLILRMTFVIRVANFSLDTTKACCGPAFRQSIYVAHKCRVASNRSLSGKSRLLWLNLRIWQYNNLTNLRWKADNIQFVASPFLLIQLTTPMEVKQRFPF